MKIPSPTFKYKIDKSALKKNTNLTTMHDSTHRDRHSSRRNKCFNWVIMPEEYIEGKNYGDLYLDWSRNRSDSMFWLDKNNDFCSISQHKDDHEQMDRESFTQQLSIYLPENENSTGLNKYWSQQIMTILQKPLDAKIDEEINYFTNTSEEKFYFYENKKSLYCSMVGKIQFSLPPTRNNSTNIDYDMPGYIQIVSKLGKYGFELQYYETTNAALKNMVLGHAFKKEMVAQAAAEEKYHDAVTALNETIQSVFTNQNTGLQPLAMQGTHILRSVEKTYQRDTNTSSQLTKVLEATNEALLHPLKPNSLNNYEQLTKQISYGKQKISKIVFGSMLGFLGVLAALIGVGLILTSTPLGFPVLVSSTSAIALGVEVIIAGLGMTAGGVFIGKSDKKQSMYKQMKFFSSKLQVYTEKTTQNKQEVTSEKMPMKH